MRKSTKKKLSIVLRVTVVAIMHGSAFSAKSEKHAKIFSVASTVTGEIAGDAKSAQGLQSDPRQGWLAYESVEESNAVHYKLGQWTVVRPEQYWLDQWTSTQFNDGFIVERLVTARKTESGPSRVKLYRYRATNRKSKPYCVDLFLEANGPHPHIGLADYENKDVAYANWSAHMRLDAGETKEFELTAEVDPASPSWDFSVKFYRRYWPSENDSNSDCLVFGGPTM